MPPKILLELNEHEEMFEVIPIGIRYRCEYCHEGEMKTDSSIPVNLNGLSAMITHKCTKCGGTLLLPKSYPYIEWVDKERC